MITKQQIKAFHPSEIGARVKLNRFGREMQKGAKHLNKIGTVVDYSKWFNAQDGTVTIKFDGIDKPASMHVGQVELI